MIQEFTKFRLPPSREDEDSSQSSDTLIPRAESEKNLSSYREKPQKESLLTTTVSTHTQAIFDQLSVLKKTIENSNADKKFETIHSISKNLISKANALFHAHAPRVSSFQVKETENKKKNKKSVEEIETQIRMTCAKMISLCHEKSKGEKQSQSSPTLRTNWITEDLDTLRKDLKILITNINYFLYDSTFPALLLIESKLKLFAKKEKAYQLNCNFDNKETQKLWNDVSTKVKNYFKENILIELNQRDLSDPPIHPILWKEEEGEIAKLLGKRALLLKQKESDIQQKLNLNEIHLLGAYQTKLLEFAKVLRNLSHLSCIEYRQYISDIEVIFKSILNVYTAEIRSEFFKAIADSLKMHYIESYLEVYIVKKIQILLEKWKQEQKARKIQSFPLNYKDLVDSHWNTLLTSTNFNTEEIKRALLSGSIWIMDSAGNVLLESPEKPEGDENEKEKINKINEYIPKTEEVISRYFGDRAGTMLTNFRLIGYNLLKQSTQTTGIQEEKDQDPTLRRYKQFDSELSHLKHALNRNLPLVKKDLKTMEIIEGILNSEPSLQSLKYRISSKDICHYLWACYSSEHPNEERLNQVLFRQKDVLEIFRSKINAILDQEIAKEKEEESLLEVDEKMFRSFAPVMKKLEEGQALTEQEETLLNYVEEGLKETNPEVLNQHGIRKIARRLFWFHKVLNQSFVIGTLGTLRFILQYIYPQDKKGLRSFDKLEDTAEVIIILGDNEKIAFEWKISTNLVSKNWLVTGILRIELPPIGLNDNSEGKKGETRAKFELTRTNKNSPDIFNEKDLEEEKEVVQRIVNIRNVLKAMEFPLDSFEKYDFIRE